MQPFIVTALLSIVFTLMLTSLFYEMMHAADRLRMDLEHDSTKSKLRQARKDIHFLLQLDSERGPIEWPHDHKASDVAAIKERTPLGWPQASELREQPSLFNPFVSDYDWSDPVVNDELERNSNITKDKA